MSILGSRKAPPAPTVSDTNPPLEIVTPFSGGGSIVLNQITTQNEMVQDANILINAVNALGHTVPNVKFIEPSAAPGFINNLALVLGAALGVPLALRTTYAATIKSNFIGLKTEIKQKGFNI
jgi:hypothetical protein